jgi:TetR/AcrR family transcriptional regulator, transcriptional repressor for nem operon
MLADMEAETQKQGKRGDGRGKLLDAALTMIRTKGYADTTVDDLCRAAGVTKGAFFHHFRSKEDLAVAAAAHFGAMAAELFGAAPFAALSDPLERLLGYIDFRRSILEGDLADYTCLLGTMVQEAYATHPAIRDACAAEMLGHAAPLEADIAAAMAASGRRFDFTAESLARHTQAVLQGAFILAKATGGPEIAVESVDHLRRYVLQLFAPEGVER